MNKNVIQAKAPAKATVRTPYVKLHIKACMLCMCGEIFHYNKSEILLKHQKKSKIIHELVCLSNPMPLLHFSSDPVSSISLFSQINNANTKIKSSHLSNK